jgi:hypothetical protein
MRIPAALASQEPTADAQVCASNAELSDTSVRALLSRLRCCPKRLRSKAMNPVLGQQLENLVDEDGFGLDSALHRRIN